MLKNIGKLIIILTVILAIFIVVLRMASIINNIKPFLLTLEPIIKNPTASYGEKMTMKYPKYFPYIEKLLVLTPADSVIYIPSDSVYPDPMWYISFKAVDEGLLYPRKIIQSEDTPVIVDDGPTYVVLFNGFPRQDIDVSKIYTFENNQIYEVAVMKYNARVFDGKLGLIKL